MILTIFKYVKLYSTARQYVGPRKLVLLALIYWVSKIVIKRFNIRISIPSAQELISTLLDQLLEQPVIPVHVCRSAFRSTPLPQIRTQSQVHSHPISAAHRSSCVPFATLYALGLGLEPFCIQASTSDVKAGMQHNRTHYWAKDVLVPNSNSVTTDSNLAVIVDVDYYMNMNDFLINMRTPVVLYTCQPNAVAYSSNEYSFTFDEKNYIRYTVKGGAEYSHQIWNYNKDVIVIRKYNKTTIFQIERVHADEHHEYVALIPIGSYNGYIASFLSRWLEAPTLTRLQPVKGQFLVMDVQEKNGLFTSIARVNNYATAYVPRPLLDTIYSATLSTSVKTGVATIQSWLENDGGRHGAAIVCDYLLTNQSKITERIYPAETGIIRYQLLRNVEEHDPDAKGLMSSFMQPLVASGYVPDNTISNERAAVIARVLAPQVDAIKISRKPESPPPRWLIQSMHEFVNLCVPIKHKGRPTEIHTVFEKQHRPAQRSLLERASGMSIPDVTSISTFLKAEPYQKAADPRIISTYNTVIKREYSRYTYSFTDYILQHHSWYTFGQNPIEIAKHVADICTNSAAIVCADANKMDGHISQICRDLELALWNAFLEFDEHTNIRNLHEKQYNSPAYTTHGFNYHVDFIRGSGSPETAFFNTIITKFIDFLYRRKHMSAIEAFNAPGKFGGDDSIATRAGPISELIDAAASIGQRYEVDEFTRGQSGVNYLSRFYTSNVWYGDYSSTCDLKRQLSKLHISSNQNLTTNVEKLRRKLSGLLRTDHHTPIIKDILETAKRLGMQLYDVEESDSWWAQYDLDTNWPNSLPQDEFQFIQSFLPKSDPTRLQIYLLTCTVDTDLLHMPLICEKENLIHNPNFITATTEEMKYPEQPTIEPASVVDAKTEITVVDSCRDFLFRTCTRKHCTKPHIPTSTTKLGITKYKESIGDKIKQANSTIRRKQVAFNTNLANASQRLGDPVQNV